MKSAPAAVNSQPTVLLPFQQELTQTAWGSSNIANGAALHAPKHSIVLRETKGENKRRGGEDAGVSEYPSVERRVFDPPARIGDPGLRGSWFMQTVGSTA
jgi:hypothetical protein